MSGAPLASRRDEPVEIHQPTGPHSPGVWAAIIIIMVTFAWQVAAAFQSSEWITTYLNVDDTQLALQVAWNWKHYGFPTFDGLHHTNGFHPLWGLLLYGVAQISQNPFALQRATVLLAAVINTLTGILLYRVLSKRIAGPRDQEAEEKTPQQSAPKEIQAVQERAFVPPPPQTLTPWSPAAGLWAVAFWSAYCLAGKPALIGLENCLLALFVVLWFGCAQRLRAAPRCWFNWLSAGVVAALMVWSRLDAAVLVAVCGLAGAIWAWRQNAIAQFLAALTVLALFGVGYLAFNLWAAGLPTPVSGQVKRLIATNIELPWTPKTAALAAADAAGTLLKHAAFGVGAARPKALSSLVRVPIAILLIAAIWRFPTWRGSWPALWLAALFLHALIIRVWLGHYHYDTIWYYAAQNVSAAAGLGLLCATLFSYPPLASKPALAARLAVALPLLIVCARLSASLHLFAQPPQEALTLNRLAAAAWIRSNVPPDARLASWNAGQLAYFSNRTVINLDGLVNDKEYLELLRAGQTGEPYLLRENVTWVIDCADDTIGDGIRPYWNTLPRDRWEEAARFGDAGPAQQVLVRRRP